MSRIPTPEECHEMGTMCACYNLRRAARAVTQVFDDYLEEAGLKATQFTVLAVLSYTKDQPPTVTQLAESLVLEQSSLSRNLAVLEKKGFVKLLPGSDRRERITTLTQSGRNALAKGFPAWRKAQAAVAGTVDPELLAAQFRSLRSITRSALTATRPSRGKAAHA